MVINGVTEKYDVDLVDKKDLGGFVFGYKIYDPDINDINDIINWLVANCTDNFIVSEEKWRILAGGYSDNKDAHARGRFNPKRRWTKDDVVHSYQIRLGKFDNVVFRLRWVDEDH